MKTAYLLAFLLLYCTIATAQSKATTRARKEKKERLTSPFPGNSTLLFKLNFAGLMDPRMPSIQPGLEFRFNKKTSAELSIGLPVRWYDSSMQLNGTYNRYYKVKADVKFATGGVPTYIGPEVFYVHQDRSRYGHGYYKGDQKIVYHYAEIEKSSWGMAFKGGITTPLGRKLYLDVSFSTGFRVETMRIKATGIRNGSIRDEWFWYADQEGTVTRPHLAMGLKLMYPIF